VGEGFWGFGIGLRQLSSHITIFAIDFEKSNRVKSHAFTPVDYCGGGAVPKRTRVEFAMRRRHVRKKVFIEAHLFCGGEKATAISCRVVDLSQGGARVKVAVPYRLPSHVYLVKDEGEIVYECETIWQKNLEAGLMFLDLCAHSKLQRLRDEMWCAEVIKLSSGRRSRLPVHSS
jgi:hypothetical protein